MRACIQSRQVYGTFTNDWFDANPHLPSTRCRFGLAKRSGQSRAKPVGEERTIILSRNKKNRQGYE